MIGHEIITASAGSGKTWNLTVRYIRLLVLGAAPGSIIALTFSRKAAREFFTAILHRLAVAASDDAAAGVLAGHVGRPELGRGDFRRHLVALVAAMPSLTLGTMDSFFVRIARNFPLELGLTGDFAILGDYESDLEQQRVLNRVFAPGRVNAEGRKEFLTAFQQATWGKDEVRLKRLLGEFLDSWLAYFQEAPHGEAWGQPDRIWPPGRTRPEADRTMGALIAEAREAMGRVRDLTDYQRATMESLFTGLEAHTPGNPAGAEWKGPLSKLLRALPDLTAGTAEITLRSKVILRPPFTDKLRFLIARFVFDTLMVCLHRTQGIYRILAIYERHYHEMVRRPGRLTFQDIQLILSGDIGPAAGGEQGDVPAMTGLDGAARESIDFRLDARYHHWLLDEFQDTSRVQWKVLKNLCDEAIQDDGGTRSFFAVGDEKQSIFTWRGADPGLFGEILSSYNEGGQQRIRVTPLALSQRSGPPVIAMVNRLCGNLDGLMELERAAGGARLWNWQEHTSAHPGRTGCGAVIEVPVSKNDGDDPDETVWITCARLLKRLQPLRRGLTCAVICHRNARAAEIAGILRQHSGMEVVCESDVMIATDNPAAPVLLALFRAAAHPADRYSWQQVLMSPLGGAVEALWPDAAGRTAWARALARRQPFTGLVLRQVAATGFAATLEYWRKQLDVHCPALDSFSAGRLDDLGRAAAAFDESGGRDIDEFIAFAEKWRVRESAHGHAIQVMTLHKSKGLTFDIVMLPDIHDPRMYKQHQTVGVGRNRDRSVAWLTTLPSKDIAGADPVLREALDRMEAAQWRERIAQLYVAVTRAKRANYILLPPPPAKDSESVTLAKMVRHQLSGMTPAPMTIGDRECHVISLDGNLDWIEAEKLKVPEPAAKAAPVVVQMDLFGNLEAAPAPAPVVRPPRTLTRRPPASIVLSLRRQSRRFGTLVHALLSRIEWMDAGTLPLVESAFAGICPRPEAREREAMESVRRCLAEPAVAAALSRPAGGVAEVWREQPFEMMADEEFVSGIFDRVTIIRDAGGVVREAHLIEYKSDQVNGEDELAVEAAAAAHAGQIRRYRRALAALTGLPADEVRANLVFTAIPRLVRCGD